MSKVKPTNHLDAAKVFENQTFEKHILEQDKTVEGKIEFKNCIFKMPLVFENITITEDLYFYDCKFEQYSIINNSNIDILSINSCEFNGGHFKLKSTKSTFLVLNGLKGDDLYVNGDYDKIFIDRVKVKKGVFKDVNGEYTQNESEIEFRKNEIENLEINVSSLFSKLTFSNGTYGWISLTGVFNDPILFKDELKTEYLFLESSIFKARIDIKEGVFENIHFNRSSFSGIILVNSFNYLDKSENNLQIERFSIHSNYFEKNITVGLSKINTLDLSNNEFKKLFEFNSKTTEVHVDDDCVNISIDGTSQGNIIIKESNIDLSIGGVNLGNLYFKDIIAYSIYVNDFQNNGNISFSNVLNGEYFIVQNSAVGKLEFLNTNFKIFREIVISDSNLEKVNFSDYPFEIKSYSSNPKMGYGIKNKSLSSANLKNVYNQLKKSAKNKGDIDTANKYQSLEYKYLFRKKGFGFDKLLLFLNWISNNHGRNWFQGVLFTLSVALICFYVYINILGEVGVLSDFLSGYIIFISSFPKLELEKYSEIEKTWDLSLIIWISRIFIAYGIYQTVAAFRKYGKG